MLLLALAASAIADVRPLVPLSFMGEIASLEVALLGLIDVAP